MTDAGQVGFCKNTQCERVDVDIPVHPGSPIALPPCGRGGETHIEQVVPGRGISHLTTRAVSYGR